MTLLLAIFSVVWLAFIVFIRNKATNNQKSTVDLIANVSAALIGVFFALVADDYRRKEEDRVITVHTVLAAQLAIIEETRPFRAHLGKYLKALSIQDADRKQQLLKDFDRYANDFELESPDVSSTLLSNEHVIKNLDEEIMFLFVRNNSLLKNFALEFNSKTNDNVSRASALEKYFLTADDASMHLCVYEKYVDGQISNDDYQTALKWQYTGQVSLPGVFVTSKCEPRSEPIDFIKWLFEHSH